MPNNTKIWQIFLPNCTDPMFVLCLLQYNMYIYLYIYVCVCVYVCVSVCVCLYNSDTGPQEYRLPY